MERKPGSWRTLANQILRSGTSIGANVEEAQAGQSKADFISKYAIALKEARETKYWLKLVKEANKNEYATINVSYRRSRRAHKNYRRHHSKHKKKYAIE